MNRKKKPPPPTPKAEVLVTETTAREVQAVLGDKAPKRAGDRFGIAKVVPDEEAATAEFILVGLERGFPDDLTRLCDGNCGRRVYYRPHNPFFVKKICPYCAVIYERIRGKGN